MTPGVGRWRGAARRAGDGSLALVISSLRGGGAERVLAALASHWTAAGRAVTVVTLEPAAADVYPLAPEVRRVALDLAAPSSHVLEGALRGVRRVAALRRALARDVRPDAVVSFGASTSVLALLACQGTGIPVLVSERTDPRHLPTRGAWSALRRALYPRAAAVVVQTESVAAWARPFCSRVNVVPNFVERPAARAAPGAEAGPWRLVALGRLNPEKGFDLLVDAFARVAAAHPGWSLTIAGEGPERGRLASLAARLGVEDRVALPGRIAEPVPFLLAAHAFALSSRREGFPNALLEAMACGLPCATFACPSGPSEIVEHGRTGLLVPAGDVAGLARALDRLLSSAADRVAMGDAARAAMGRLAPAQVLGRWDALLDAIAPAPAVARRRTGHG